jgi:carboxyl-terminal processing protease
VSRAAAIFFIFLLLPASVWAQPAASAATFATATAASVWGAALSYIAPRSLQPLTIPQMAIWGLNGLAALDPDLNTTLQNGEIRLYGPDQLIIAVPAPAPDDAQGWGNAAARVASAAFTASPALQQAGTQGLISSFFDELFNHFDPYSRYEPPLQAAQEQLMITGLAGTGITFGAQGGTVIVTNVAAESPAENAGIVPGNVLVAMDGKRVWSGEAPALNDAMNGIYGSTVTLSFADPDMPGAPAEQITLTRAAIPPNTILTLPDQPPGILALKITSFNKGTAEQFSSALAAAMAGPSPPSGLILDLRGNRGGVLRQAILVADSLLPAGRIMQAEGRDPDADQSFSAEGADLTSGMDITVLVDGQTASAAEILAAALADNGRAVVIGSETLGKGLVQTVTSLPDGGRLLVTWSRMLAPRGWPLQTLGLMPQVCTSLGPAAMQSELAALAKGHNLLAPVLARARAMRAPVPVNAVLAVRSACPADIGSDTDFTAAAFLLGHPAAYQAALLQ